MLFFAALGLASIYFFMKSQAKGELCTTGPYGLVRHPTYLVYFAFSVCLIVLYFLLEEASFGIIGFILLILSILNTRRIPEEEQRLAQVFPEYEEYRKKVRWRIVPYIY